MATNKEIVENAYSSFATGDVPAMADDVQWTEADGFPLAAPTSALRQCSKGCSYGSGRSAISSPW